MSRIFLRDGLKKYEIKRYDWVFLCILFIFCFYYSSVLPLNFDEAYNLQVPIKLVTELRYDTFYHTRNFDAITSITTGPTVLLPVALFFKIFGIGILQARIVPVIFFYALIVIFYMQSLYYFHNRIYGLALVLLILSVGQIEIAFYVLGEIASLFFLISGLAIWNADNRYKYLSFVIMGLSVVTKLYFILSIIPLLITLILSNSENNYPLRHKIKEILLCGLCFFLPYLVYESIKLMHLGFGGYLEYFDVLKEFTRSQIVEGALQNNGLYTDLLGQKLITVAKGIFPKMPIHLVGLLFAGITINFLNHIRQGVTKCRRFYIALYLLFVTYLVWFVFIDAMGWWRRMLPFGIVALYLVCDFFRTWLNYLKSQLFHNSLKLIIAIIFVVFILPTFAESFVKFQHYHQALIAQREFAERVNYYISNGYKIGVYGWWQAPEISFLLGGVKFKHFQCDRKYSNKFLVIYTKLHETITPQDAEALRQCLGDLNEVSIDQQYYLFTPKNNSP